MKIKDDLSHRVIGCAIEVHKQLGPGLLESTYERCLALELAEQEIKFARQVRVPICYKNVTLDEGFRADLLIEGALVVELKAVDRIIGVHTAQLLTYLRLMNVNHGLIINFNVSALRNGIRRYIRN